MRARASVCVSMVMCVYILPQPSFLRSLGSQLDYSKAGNTSEGNSIMNVSTIFSIKALFIFTVDLRNWFLFVLSEAYKLL